LRSEEAKKKQSESMKAAWAKKKTTKKDILSIVKKLIAG
jgi:hypothetical protein